MSWNDKPFNIEDYVYEGIWKNHHETPFRKWTWTLSDSKALFSLAILSILIAFTQARTWVLVRYVLYQWKPPVRLYDPDRIDPLFELSQGTAITEAYGHIKGELGSWIRHLRSKINGQNQTPRENNPPLVSPLFGVFALINIVIYIISGIALPWGLSGGSLETPIVKSKITSTCLKAQK